MLQLLSNTVTTPIFTLRQSVAIARALADIAAEDANSTDDETIILKFREIFSTLLTDAQQNSILDIANTYPQFGKEFADYWGGLPE
jgi:hypothetical protein